MGTPIPIWSSEDGKERVTIGSIAQLKELTGTDEEITDLHMHNIDHLTIPSKIPGNPPLKRIPEVFDCWFESGSMPYGQQHYPFENKEKFEHGFPADFIAEGLDQTRGWFYTLMVLSTALFDKPAFKNLIVNGLVLAEDGKKMSKRLKNYPEVSEIVNNYGADALRLYLINSPVVRAEPFRFENLGAKHVIRDVFIPWYNSYKLFMEQVRTTTFQYNNVVAFETDNVMDKWILSSLQSLNKFVRQEMAAYRLYTVIPRLLSFVDSLSKWYIRFNKLRLKDVTDLYAKSTLFEVLFTLCTLMAPFTPFLVERMYQNLKQFLSTTDSHLRQDSIHYLMITEIDEKKVNLEVEQQVSILQHVIDLGRKSRDQISYSMRMPLPEAIISHRVSTNLTLLKNSSIMINYLQKELNVKKIIFADDYESIAQFKAEPNMRSLGKRLGKLRKQVSDQVSSFSQSQLTLLDAGTSITITLNDDSEIEVIPDDVKLACEFIGDKTIYSDINDKEGWMILIHQQPDHDCLEDGHLREIISKIQKSRKENNLLVSDRIRVTLRIINDSPIFTSALQHKLDTITKAIHSKVTLITSEQQDEDGSQDLIQRVQLTIYDNETVEISMYNDN